MCVHIFDDLFLTLLGSYYVMRSVCARFLSSVCAQDLSHVPQRTSRACWGGGAQFDVFYRIWAKLTEWTFFVIMYIYSLEVMLVSLLF